MDYEQSTYYANEGRQPRGKDTSRSPGSSAATSRLALSDVSILIVEDDPSSAKLLSLLLTNAGAAARIANSAEEALIALESLRPQVIVLDLILPRMSGLLFMENLRADDRNRDIVVIAVTAINGPETQRIVLAAGCAGYVRKPVDTSTFAQTIASFLGAQS